MSGTLYLVATPIGNLEDITLRALRILRLVDVIAAEDTRRTAQLLAHFGIETKMVSCHQHNQQTRIPELVGRLRSGESVAVVSDAGTPGIADPGLELVQACVAAGITVDALPGASAVLTAAVLSGFSTGDLTFLGFPPHRGIDRTRWIESLSGRPGTLVLLESPHRILSCLSGIALTSADRPMMVGRELTKLHQTLYRGTASEIAQQIGQPKGEFTVVLGPWRPDAGPRVPLSPGAAVIELGDITKTLGLGKRAALAELARRHGIRPNEAYQLVEQAKRVSDDQ